MAAWPPQTLASVPPNGPAVGTIAGSIAAGMPNSSSRSGSQWPVFRLNSMVRAAMDGSVACTAPPDSCQISQQLTSPKSSWPRAAAARAPENATYLICDRAAGRTAVLRVHRTGYHPPGAIESELAWLQALRRDEGLLTPAVYRAADGRQVVDIEIGPMTRQAVLFEWLPGTEPPQDRLAERFELLGGICARMHRHARSWPRPSSSARSSPAAAARSPSAICAPPEHPARESRPGIPR